MKNTFEINGDVAIIKLQNGHETMIDADMIQKVVEFKNTWYAQKPTDKFYVCGWSRGKSVKLHRLILNVPEGKKLMVDHINGNTLDNRVENLRIVTSSQNQQNRMGPQRNSSTGIRGVSWIKNREKWVAHLTIGKKKIYLGIYSDVSEAESVVVSARNNLMTHNHFDKEGVNT